MKLFQRKIQLIFIPFLKIAFVYISSYLLIYWLLFIRLNTDLIPEDVRDSVLPLFIPFIPVLIWLRPKIKLLKLSNWQGKRGRLPGLYFFVASLAMGVPTLLAQDYMETDLGRLINLGSISSLNNFKSSKYYTLHNYYIDKRNYGVSKYEFVNTGSHGSKNTVMRIFIVLPVFDKIDDTIRNNCDAWIGICYNIPYGTKLEGKALIDARNTFFSESENDFKSRDVQKFEYLDKVSKTWQLEGFQKAIENSKKACTIEAPIFTEVNDSFENRNGYTLFWAIFSFLGCSGLFLLIVLIPAFARSKLNNEEEDR